MHICFLCNEYPPGQHGGIGSKIQVLGRSLVNRGHKVTVMGMYAPERHGVENDHGVTVIRLPRSTVPRTGFLVGAARLGSALKRLHETSRIDVLDGPENSLAAVPRSFPAAKVIRMSGGHHFFAVTLGTKPRPWRSWVERRSFAHADFLCGVSRFVAETTRDLLQLGTTPIEVLPNPVDTSFFRPHPEVPEEKGLMVFVGTICEKKGIRQLVQAMPAIVRAQPHARLLVVGRDWNDPGVGGSYLGYLKTIMPREAASRVEFKGPIEHAELPTLLARAEICVYPSHMEAMPNAWLEGLAMGKAVLASRIGPSSEVLEDGRSGVLCDPYDPTSIATEAIRLLGDASLRRRLGERARARAVEQFSPERLTGLNEQFFSHCIAGRNAA
jgi:glycosyltransferase involved in cell wall biosynthesis